MMGRKLPAHYVASRKLSKHENDAFSFEKKNEVSHNSTGKREATGTTLKMSTQKCVVLFIQT